jgi:hypothetical protein
MLHFFVLLLILAIALGVPALVALPVMKFYARTLPLSQLFFIGCWSIFLVSLILGAAEIAVVLVFPSSIATLISLASVPWIGAFVALITLCPTAILISRSLKRKGFALPFPGIGARAVAAIWVTWELAFWGIRAIYSF